MHLGIKESPHSVYPVSIDYLYSLSSEEKLFPRKFHLDIADSIPSVLWIPRTASSARRSVTGSLASLPQDPSRDLTWFISSWLR